MQNRIVLKTQLATSLMYFFLQKVVNLYFAIRNVNTKTLRPKHSKYYTHDLCLAQISHSSLVQIIHALVALPLDAGIICTSDLWEIQNTLLIIRDSLRSSSHDIVGYFLPATRH